MEEERDFVVFEDDDGNEFELDVIDYFDYENEEYAVLIDMNGMEDEDGEEEAEQDVYIMKIVVNGDTEEFVAADDDKMEALAAIAEARLSEMDDECDCGDDCDCGEHDCGEHECGCGCHHDHDDK